MSKHKTKMGLVLTGGGARAAYQAGALKAVAGNVDKVQSPFDVITGVSAGAINGAYVASRADEFYRACSDLVVRWETLHTARVFRTDVRSLTSIGSKWIRDIGMGGVLSGGTTMNYLLDTQPLREWLQEDLHLDRLQKFIDEGVLQGFACTATDYISGSAVTFFEAQDGIEPWERSTRIGIREKLTIEHIMSSSAIPIFFPPVQMNQSWYGDGCLRLSAPLSPAIHLGAEKILAIGIRYFRTPSETEDANKHPPRSHKDITMADVAGTILNAVFLDSLEFDIERTTRINEMMNVPEGRSDRRTHSFRPIPILAIRPSQDLGKLAADLFEEFPRVVRFLLKGIGADAEKGWDLVSYLAFDRAYTGVLVKLGYADAMRMRDDIREFFKD